VTLFGQTLILYLVIGCGVAGAVYLTAGPRRWFRAATAVPFWPVYLPLLLTRSAAEAPPAADALTGEPDEWAAAIERADRELAAALAGLDGWAEDVLARERSRIRDLRTAWLSQARRIHGMDRLLAEPEFATDTDDGPTADDDRLRASRTARRRNVERLRGLRQRAADDLNRSLAWVRELVSMIHLAKFSGAPAERAEELVAQIAAAVEGLSEMTCEDGEPFVHGLGRECTGN
jgi:hypothetical protein